MSYWMAKDRCTGTCTNPALPACVATKTKPYRLAWWGPQISTQDDICACGLANSGVTGGTGAPPSGGSKILDEVKETLKPTGEHTEKTDEAIKAAGGGD